MNLGSMVVELTAWAIMAALATVAFVGLQVVGVYWRHYQAGSRVLRPLMILLAMEAAALVIAQLIRLNGDPRLGLNVTAAMTVAWLTGIMALDLSTRVQRGSRYDDLQRYLD